MATKWGIASCGKVSLDFVSCLMHLPREHHEVVAVADRNLETSQPFAKKFNISKAYGNYKELSKDKDIEIVYISTINPQHFDVAKMMLEAGKHVLCEKPACMRYHQLKQLTALAKEKKLFFMEGLWGRFFPVYEQLRQELKKGTIGTLEAMTVCFGSKQNHIDRLRFKHLGGGCMLDIGVYALHFVVMVFDGEKPLTIQATGILNDDGVDEAVMVSMLFPGEKIANLTISQRTALQNDAVVAGSKGKIVVQEPFWCPTTLITPDKKYEIPLPKMPPTHFPNSAGFQYEATAVRECLQKGLLESPLAPHAHTELISLITGEIHKQLNITYPEEVPW